MGDFITTLSSELTSAKLWNELNGGAVFIGGMVIFAFGYYVIRKIIGGVSRGKARI